jgi:hypothetical protein
MPVNGDFRLTGLVAQGSLPWAIVGFMAILGVGITRYLSLKLSVQTPKGKEGNMKETKHALKLVCYSLVETFWTIEANIVAGSLPA